MSLPVSDRAEYAVSSLGLETYPQGIVINNSLYTLQLGYSRLILREYNGYQYVFDLIVVDKFKVSSALKNDLSVDTNRIWVWVVSPENNLSLYEIEPHPSSDPEITYSKLNLASNVDSISVDVKGSDAVRLNVLYHSGDFKALTYSNIRNSDPPSVYDLSWSGTRLNQFSSYVSSDKSTLTISYLDVASPPNVYTDSYVIETPANFSASLVGLTNQVNLAWNTAYLATEYLIERDTNPAFPSAVQFTTSNLFYSDNVPQATTYYYRVRSLNTPLLIQSAWSSSDSVTLALAANFSGIPLSTVTGDPVQFTDTSTPAGTISTWDWDFGDGSPHSALQNPTHIYTDPGIYTVSLEIGDGLTTDTETKPTYITIAPSIVADFVGVPTYVIGGNSVQFTDLSTGTPTSWDWDFGDGSPHATTQNPLHVYTAAGFYTVTLIASDAYVSSPVTKIDYIEVIPQLIADFVGTPTVCDSNEIVQFTDLSAGTPISWDWDFGDDSPHATTQNPLHVYTTAGLFPVTLTVYDGAITVDLQKPDYITVNMVADFSVQNGTGFANLQVQFIDTTLGNPTSWLWNFGDGGTSTEQNPVHIYEDPGYYTVTLIASREIGTGPYTDTETKADIVTVYTHAQFSALPRVGYGSISTQFVDESTGAPTSWYWNFGDGTDSYDMNPTHTYTSPGEYTVTLTVSSSFNSDSETKVGYIIVEGTATPDIAPEPDVLLYMGGSVKAYRESKGIRVVFLRKSNS